MESFRKEGQNSIGNWGYGKVYLLEIVIDRDNEKKTIEDYSNLG